MRTSFNINESPLQICERILYQNKERYRHTNYARRWLALYRLFNYWRETLLASRKDRPLTLSQIIAPHFASLCEVMEHAYTLIPGSHAESREHDALVGILKDAEAAGYCGIGRTVCYEDLSSCLDEMYNLLSVAMLATSEPARPGATGALKP